MPALDMRLRVVANRSAGWSPWSRRSVSVHAIRSWRSTHPLCVTWLCLPLSNTKPRLQYAGPLRHKILTMPVPGALLTVSLGLLGRLDEAKESLARTLKLQPDLSTAHVTNDTVFADPGDRDRFLLGLRKAGLKN